MADLRRAVVLALVPIFVAGWAPVAPGQAATPKDEVVIGISQEPDILVPGLGGNLAVSSEVIQALFVGGAFWSDDLKLVPIQAREIPTFENGQWKLLPGGKMQLTWHLKPLKWQDGEPVTGEDYVFTFRAVMNEKVPVIERVFEKHIENIFAPAPDTLVVTFKDHFAYANTEIIRWGPWPRHLLEKAYHDNPGGLDKLPFGNDPKATIGSGPYRLVSWQKGSSIVAEANPLYTLAPPRVKRIVWRVITDTNTLGANMLSGAIDTISPIGITFTQGVQLEQQIAQRRLAEKVIFTPGMVWEHIDLNLNNSRFKDRRVRQALLYALDRQAMVDALFQGKQAVAASYLPPKHYGFDPAAPTYAYSPERAKQLFAEAGWTPGADGILRNAPGERFTVTIGTTAGNRVREDVEQILQNQWQKVGVELKISNQPARVFFGETTRHREFEMAMYAWVQNPVSDCETLYTTDNIPSAQNAYNGQNFSGFSNAEMDRLCHAIPTELDQAKRVAMLKQTQAIFANELPVLPLYFRVDVSSIKNGFRNWKPTGVGHNGQVTWNAPQWAWAPQVQ
jgi:peptide/nickel transport system substrate-binding protein